MSQRLSVATVIEKNRLSSDVPFVILLDIEVVDPSSGVVVEVLHLARNSEDVVFQSVTYPAWDFNIELKSEANSQPTITLSIKDFTRAIQARMQAYGGGVGFNVTVYVVNGGALSSPPEVVEYYQVVAAQAADYVVTFTLGAENALRFTFPRRRQTKNFCQWRYKERLTCGFQDRALFLPQVTGNYAKTVNAAKLQITGDIDVRVRFGATQWVTAASRGIIGKGNSYLLYSNTVDGFIIFRATSAGTPYFYTLGTPTSLGLVNGQPKWLRATLKLNDGAGHSSMQAYTSRDGNEWTPFGSPQLLAVLPSLDVTASDLEIGRGGTAEHGGNCYYAEVRNGIDGDIVALFDPTNAPSSATTSFQSSSGEVWTLVQAGGTPAALVYPSAFLPTCDLTLDGANGCDVHANSLRFGAYPGMNANGIRYI